MAILQTLERDRQPADRGKNKTRKPTGMRYPESMTAEAILQKSVRYDRSGKPLEKELGI